MRKAVRADLILFGLNCQIFGSCIVVSFHADRVGMVFCGILAVLSASQLLQPYRRITELVDDIVDLHDEFKDSK